MSRPSRLKKSSAIAAIAGKSELETRSGTAMRAALKLWCPCCGWLPRYESRHVHVGRCNGCRKLEGALDHVDGGFDARRVDFTQWLAGNLRKFGDGLSLVLGNGRVHLGDEPLHDCACSRRISEGVLHAADCRRDEAAHNIWLARDRRSGRHDAVAVIT